jgi:hypothetical protein
MTKFEPIKKNPGDIIRSEDWNRMQEGISSEMEHLEEDIRVLRAYIDTMAKSVTLTNMESPVGSSYTLDDATVGGYATTVLGYITRQFILGVGETGEICKFGVLDYFDVLHYWAGANRSDKGCLEVALEYVDGTIHVEPELYLHDYTQLQVKGSRNPYFEYLLSSNERVWYKYAIRNPYPNKEVRYVSFKDVDEDNAPRIANVIQHVARVRPV